MPSRRRRIHRAKRSNKPLFIAGLTVAVVALAITIIYVTNISNAECTLTIYTRGQGSITPGNGTYSRGATVNLKAVNAANWTFYGWSGDVSGWENTSITMDGNKIVTATFVENKNNRVLLVTSMGNITILLRDDMPITTENFRNLTRHGIYDNTTFHRVIADFMIQGGDPTGTGYGDPTIPSIPDEFTSDNKNLRGTIAMANKGANFPNSGSSQFFINVVYNSHLDRLHPVFGRVMEGMDVVDRISKVATDTNDRPIGEVKLIKAIILD
ncbi:MAG: peptidylprolyl isomerase [Candidatus Bathyarchaeia archaeon]